MAYICRKFTIFDIPDVDVDDKDKGANFENVAKVVRDHNQNIQNSISKQSWFYFLNFDDSYTAIIVKSKQSLFVLLFNLLLCHTNSRIYQSR